MGKGAREVGKGEGKWVRDGEEQNKNDEEIAKEREESKELREG